MRKFEKISDQGVFTLTEDFFIKKKEESEFLLKLNYEIKNKDNDINLEELKFLLEDNEINNNLSELEDLNNNNIKEIINTKLNFRNKYLEKFYGHSYEWYKEHYNKSLFQNIFEIITEHVNNVDTNSTGIVSGTLEFEVQGEANCNIQIKAVNENVVSSGAGSTAAQEFGTQNIKFKVYYPSHTFKPIITRQVPFNLANVNVPVLNTLYSKYSYYSPSSNTIFLGDGEYLTGQVEVNATNEPYSDVYIKSVTFERVTSSLKDGIGAGAVQSDKVDGASSGSSYNTHDFILYHNHEYSVYGYRTSNSGTWSWETNGINNMYRLTIDDDKFIEVRNETIKETSFVGNLVVEYANYAAGNGYAKYRIPVYVQVRNCPCADETEYFKAYIGN